MGPAPRILKPDFKFFMYVTMGIWISKKYFVAVLANDSRQKQQDPDRDPLVKG